MPAKKDKIIGDAQSDINDSINQAQARLEAINADIKKAEENKAFLQLETESVQKNIDFLNGNLEKRKQDTADFEENYKLRLIDLDNVKKEIEDKEVELIKLEKDSTEDIKNKINGLDLEVEKLEKNKVNLLKENSSIGKKIIESSEMASASKNLINTLEVRKNELQDLIKVETKNSEESISHVDKLKDQIESYTDVLDVLKKDIKDNQAKNNEIVNARAQLEKDLVEAKKKVDEANAEFDKMSKKSQILIDRTEFQDGQEIYLKEQFEKIGREYQPYAQ